MNLPPHLIEALTVLVVRVIKENIMANKAYSYRVESVMNSRYTFVIYRGDMEVVIRSANAFTSTELASSLARDIIEALEIAAMEYTYNIDVYEGMYNFNIYNRKGSTIVDSEYLFPSLETAESVVKILIKQLDSAVGGTI